MGKFKEGDVVYTIGICAIEQCIIIAYREDYKWYSVWKVDKFYTADEKELFESEEAVFNHLRETKKICTVTKDFKEEKRRFLLDSLKALKSCKKETYAEISKLEDKIADINREIILTENAIPEFQQETK